NSVRCETPTAAAIPSVVVASKPCAQNRSSAADTRAARVRAFLRSRSPAAVRSGAEVIPVTGASGSAAGRACPGRPRPWSPPPCSGRARAGSGAHLTGGYRRGQNLSAIATCQSLPLAWSERPADRWDAPIRTGDERWGTMTATVEEAAPERTGAGPGGLRGSPWGTLVAIAFGVMMVALDGTIVAVANPAIGADLNASLGELRWATHGYLLGLAVFLITAGKLGDRYGHRRVFLIGVVGFTLTSVAIALSSAVAPLVAFRIL